MTWAEIRLFTSQKKTYFVLANNLAKIQYPFGKFSTTTQVDSK